MSERINISGKKIVTYGGSAEMPYGTIDTSFKTIYNDLFRFRKIFRDKSAGLSERLFRALDQPGHYYFKLLFYFSNPYANPSNPMSSNLLGTTYTTEDAGPEGKDEEYDRNTALNYLYNNREYTRFNYLAEFIQLLSDISTKSPWYFQSVSGLDQAIERQEVGQRDFKIEEERKQITIKCLPDAYDNRIGRMLDLYRAVVWSQSLKKWIVPKNLRKFDMGIYIFNSPIKTLAGGRYGLSGKIADRVLETTFKEYYGEESEDTGEYEEQMYKPPVDMTGSGNGAVGCKYIELRGCEIDYNSSKSAYSELDNAEGKAMEYEIIIKYDTAVEDRFDPIFKNYIGDFVIEDLMRNEIDELRDDNPYSYIEEGDGIAEGVTGDPFGAEHTNTLVESALGMGTAYLNTFINKVMFGNIYGFSLGKLDSIMTTDPMSAVMRTGREINNAKLIKKRIEDFTNPDKGTRELAGRSLYNGWVETTPRQIENEKLPGWKEPEDYDWDIENKKFTGWGEQQTQGEELGRKKFSDWNEPQTQGEEIEGKKFTGWGEQQEQHESLDKSLPGHPGEPTMDSGELPKTMPDYPGEPTMDDGGLPKKFPGIEP